MANERYAWGNTLASFNRATTSVVEQTTAGRFDPAFVASSIACPSNLDFMDTIPFVDSAAPTTVWIHFEVYWNGTFQGSNGIQFFNSAGIVVAKLAQTSTASNGTFQLQYWNGSAFVTTGPTFTMVQGTLYRLDIAIVCGASGSLTVYSAGTQVSTIVGLNAAVNNIARVRFAGAGNQGNYSQIMIANFDTRDSRYMQDSINGNGANTGGTGTYTDINETVLDETTFISFNAAALKKSFTHTARAGIAGYTIGAICVNGRGRVNGAGPADGQMLVRSGGTDYLSSNLSFAGSFEARGRYWALNPNGAVPWTLAAYNAAEIGILTV